MGYFDVSRLRTFQSIKTNIRKPKSYSKLTTPYATPPMIISCICNNIDIDPSATHKIFLRDTFLPRCVCACNWWHIFQVLNILACSIFPGSRQLAYHMYGKLQLSGLCWWFIERKTPLNPESGCTESKTKNNSHMKYTTLRLKIWMILAVLHEYNMWRIFQG